MIASFFKSYFVHAILVSIILLLMALIAIGVLFIKSSQNKSYDIKDVNVVEYRLPSLDLEKYEQLDKIDL
jgi:hypothetical protein